MIRENVLEYFNDSKKETFRWFRGSYFSKELCDFNLTFRTQNLGKLNLPSGKIVASDPLVFFDEKPFIRGIEKGSYDVILSIAHISYYDQIHWENERVAFAMLKLHENLPVRWETAVTENTDGSESNSEKFFGYSVDSGTGCFMDVESQEILNDLLFDEEYKFFDLLDKELTRNYIPAWSWINYDFEGLETHNLIAFSSGMGDGGYASYFGFDKDDRPVCLVTDFKVVKDSLVE